MIRVSNMTEVTTHPWFSLDPATGIATFSDYAEIDAEPSIESFQLKFKATIEYASFADFDTDPLIVAGVMYDDCYSLAPPAMKTPFEPI